MRFWPVLILAAALASGQSAQTIITQTVALLHLEPGMVAAEALAPELDSELVQAVGLRGKRIVIRPDAEGDPHLTVASIHVAVLSDAVLRLPYPERILAHIRSAIRPEGRAFLRTSNPSLRDQLEAAGFDFHSSHELAPGQFLLEFVRP